MTACKHTYHKKCLKEWWAIGHNCPYCRAGIPELNDILEGQEEETDFPFGVEDSSQINLRLASSYFRAFRTIFRKAIFDALPKNVSPECLDFDVKNKIAVYKDGNNLHLLGCEGTNIDFQYINSNYPNIKNTLFSN
mgnify:CR=1 FL=1